MGNPVMMKLQQWEVKGYYPHVPHLGNSMETGGGLQGLTDWIPATVPGSVHADLQRAGWIEDPYYGMNSLKCEWVENRWWLYSTTLNYKPGAGERVHLCFKGLDYKAHIYLDYQLLGVHEGMFGAVSYDITERLLTRQRECESGEAEESASLLRVLFEHAPDEMGQIGYTSRTSTQKSRFAYKWDFSTRLVPVGFWDEVCLCVTGQAAIDEVHLQPTVDRREGRLQVTSHIRTGEASGVYRCHAEVWDGETKVAEASGDYDVAAAGMAASTIALQIAEPQLWYPNGVGAQPLYRVVLTVTENGICSDRWEGMTGFRSLRWISNEGAGADVLPYTVEVNGERVYIKGVNLPPIDQQYGTVTPQRYEQMVSLMKEANINLVRVWGGGLIEKQVFYECCDRAGILVWQEFIQSSSGIDNVPSQHPRFLELLTHTAISALKVKRNHISLACWSGGNELTDAAGVPATYEDANLAMLQRLVEQYHPGAYFLPTSASGPNEFLNLEQPGRNHDVHGPWKYGGHEGHYELYNRSDSRLHSEFGVDGCCSMASMRRFLPEQELRVTSMRDSVMWRHHGEWWDTLERDTELFGPLERLEDYIQASQWTQAEGIRYALEANRRRQFSNSGSIIWQFNEPFPNASCTSVVDYYGEPKMAYYWLRKAYAPRHISLAYDKLVYAQGESWTAACYLHNSLEACAMEWRAEGLSLSGEVLWSQQGNAQLEANSCRKVAELRMNVDGNTPEIFLVRLQLAGEEANVYLFSTRRNPWLAPLLEQPEARLSAVLIDSCEQGSQAKRRYAVTNEGERAALYVKAEASGIAPLDFRSRHNYTVIMPGETVYFDIEYKPSQPPASADEAGGAAAVEDTGSEEGIGSGEAIRSEPEIVFTAMGSSRALLR
ncbi:glycoside hydrolase family 2 protein [Paenibacillus sp. 598K]|uniref:glycoside hydrolase family 2 protein n=1 Tax=Paenibacillus sp. 598K TaxID=1117987 RepID=UPI000FFF1B2D|nr:glycoside hydrolase family 2 TIM barrel-domain containing protein [Paenibacillus sp. 598K]